MLYGNKIKGVFYVNKNPSTLIIGLFTLGATSLYNPKVLGTPSEKPKKKGGLDGICLHIYSKYCKVKIDGERACSLPRAKVNV